MSARRITLHVGEQGLRTLANDAIQNDFMRGLVEIVTNSDDSYCRLERLGKTTSGNIDITLVRRTRTGRSLLRVRDLAEGMDSDRMEQVLGNYGRRTSGEGARGVFGMGLKDTINAFGKGTIRSIRDGRLYRCTLQLRERDQLEVFEPRVATNRDREELGIPVNGTVIDVVISNRNIRIPIMSNLRRAVQSHVCLRKIISDPKRSVVVHEEGEIEEPVRYVMPKSTVLRETKLAIPHFEGVEAQLIVRQAESSEPLSQSGGLRTGGILIMSGRAVHEATLFGFDEDPYAGYLFGELVCEHIYKLQRQGEIVVYRNRDGLCRNHPFARALYRAAGDEVARIIKEIREKAEQTRQAIESEQTRRRFRDAVQQLNKIAAKELDLIHGVGAGKGGGQPLPPMRTPVGGFEFIPDDYKVLVGTKEQLRLRIEPDEVVKPGEVVQVSASQEGVRILTANAAVPAKSKEGLCTVLIEVEGIQPGAEVAVIAQCRTKSTIASVEVVSELKKRKEGKRGGLFKEIKYAERPGLARRVWFEQQTGVIWVNTMAPSIQLYFGPQGEGQNEPQNRVLVAELVTEVAVFEIGKEKRRTKQLAVPLGVAELDFFLQHVNALKDTWAPVIHKALVERKHRRI